MKRTWLKRVKAYTQKRYGKSNHKYIIRFIKTRINKVKSISTYHQNLKTYLERYERLRKTKAEAMRNWIKANTITAIDGFAPTWDGLTMEQQKQKDIAEANERDISASGQKGEDPNGGDDDIDEDDLYFTGLRVGITGNELRLLKDNNPELYKKLVQLHKGEISIEEFEMFRDKQNKERGTIKPD